MRTSKVSQPQLFNDLRRVFDGPKIIHITIAKGTFTVLYKLMLTAVRADVICLDRMVVEQKLEFEMSVIYKDFCVVSATNKM